MIDLTWSQYQAIIFVAVDMSYYDSIAILHSQKQMFGMRKGDAWNDYVTSILHKIRKL